MARMFVLLFFLNIALVIAALVDCLGGERAPRNLPKAAWVFVILLLPVIGPVAWFAAGHPRAEPAGGPRRSAPRRPVAPDDDPDFLAELSREPTDDETMLRRWEEEMRRRDDEPDAGDPKDKI